MKSVKGANYTVIIQLLKRDAFGAQYQAVYAMEQGYRSELVEAVANYNLIDWGIDDMLEDIIDLILRDWAEL